MTNLNTSNLNLWPSPAELKKICKSLTILEYIFNDFERYDYKVLNNVEVFELNTHQGSDCNIYFTEKGAIFRGFDKSSPMSNWNTPDYSPWPGMIDNIPTVFQDIFQNHIDLKDKSFLLWNEGSLWEMGNIKKDENIFFDNIYQDGSSLILEYIPLDFETYISYENKNYDFELDHSLIEDVYDFRSIKLDKIKQFSSFKPNLEKFLKKCIEINYPPPS